MKPVLELYKEMVLIRLLEDRLQLMCDRGEAGDLHFNKGQEAISVGVCASLLPTDHIVTHHRTIAHQIAKGAKLHPLIAEMIGRATGINGGRAGEMHISDHEIRHDFSFQLVGTCIPVAAGLAWALKNYKKNDELVAVFFGDATTSNGQFHEGLNIAAIHNVPLLLICENNHLAGNIRPKHFQPVPSVSVRCQGYQFPTEMVDGNDIHAVMSAVHRAVPYVRSNGPFLIECDTTRLCWHKQGQRDARSAQEIAEQAKRDPLLALEERYPNIIGAKTQVYADANAQLDEAFSKALNDPFPEVYHD